MNWFFIALIGPILYAVTNHTDKYLLEKYFKGGEAGAVVLFSAIFSIVTLPIIYIVEPAVFSLGFKTTLALSLNGMINIVCLILYFKSLRDEDASAVVPFYQTIPIFGFVLGYFILGEVLDLKQIIACLLIIIGTVILSLDLTATKISIKKRVALLMLANSFLFALSGVIFKLIATEEGFWASAFWEFSGKVIIGIILFIFVSSYRKEFLWVMKANSLPVLSISSFNESIFILADGFSIYATLLAPIVLVMTVNGFQPVFVFIFGIILTLFFPKIAQESLSKNVLIQKISAIGIITIGTVILGLSGAL
ncbi:MAG: EamA family transporter [Candidatus Moraniibacteriota bacterium]